MAKVKGGGGLGGRGGKGGREGTRKGAARPALTPGWWAGAVPSKSRGSLSRPVDHAPIDARKIRTYPLAKRNSKFTRADYAKPVAAGATVRELLASLPRVLAADDLKAVAAAVVAARRAGRPVILGMGAHVIKTGLSPILIDLLEKRVITSVAMNGAGIVHDTELALVGHTSEDVDATLAGGGFGGAEETSATLNEALKAAGKKGVGRAVGDHLNAIKAKYARESLLATCARLKVSCTVHVALGTDIFHMHPATSGAALGEGSLRDFRVFCSAVKALSGGVYLNIGSAVILPEVFLKAVSLARNLGTDLDDVTTANFDFIKGYRPLTNVVKRPTGGSGKGYNLVGHHEIMIPLLAAAVLEELVT